MNPQNERARAGLRAVETADRYDKLLADGTQALGQKDYELAKIKVNAVLSEKPDHIQARALLREINEKAPQPQNDIGLSKAFKQPITIEFREAPLKQVFDVISRRSGLNFV